MNMTHYMELLATNQPWNLIIYMAIPVILAETIAITELVLLFTRNFGGTVRRINRYAGIMAGIYFVPVFLTLMKNAVIPLTLTGGWRGPADVIAVLSYLAGIFPLGGIALLELGMIGRGLDDTGKMKLPRDVCRYLPRCCSCRHDLWDAQPRALQSERGTT
jgi:hypothetical protein